MDDLPVSRRELIVPQVAILTGFTALLICLVSSAAAGEQENLALNKPATCSSSENKEHDAAAANDGDAGTCWRADDEPEGVPDWWQVDLRKPADLAGCELLAVPRHEVPVQDRRVDRWPDMVASERSNEIDTYRAGSRYSICGSQIDSLRKNHCDRLY